MTRNITLFSRTTSGTIKMWSCWIESDGVTVTSQWGIQGGALQTTSETLTSRGKKGTAAFRSAREVAIEEHDRQVKKKIKAGAVLNVEDAVEAQIEKMKVDLDFDKLPKSFAPAKPIREIDPSTARDWDKQGLFIKQRKRDGMRYFIVKGKEKTRIYSRGMEDMTEHFSWMTHELDLPSYTVLDAELVGTNPDGSDNHEAIQQVSRALPARSWETAQRLMTKQKVTLQFMVFDLLFHRQLPVWQLPYEERYKALRRCLIDAHDIEPRHVVPMESYDVELSILEKVVNEKAWEGLVLWRKDLPTVVHVNRSPKRTNCYKYKPLKEDDFVALGYEKGKGRLARTMGKLHIAMYENGRLVPMGKVGTGFSDKDRDAAMGWKFPCAVQIKYEKRTKNAVRHPVFMRKRDDKKPKECTWN
jgi:ATP-dependent DNA ligase